MADWISPNSHNDPDNKWSSESNAYDDSTASPAINAWGDNGHFLELYTPSPILCSAIRILCKRFTPPSSYYSANVDIDWFYEGQWRDLFDGLLGSGTSWNVKSLASEQVVTGMRVRHNSGGSLLLLFEVDFYGEPVATRGLVGGGLAGNILTGKGLV